MSAPAYRLCLRARRPRHRCRPKPPRNAPGASAMRSTLWSRPFTRPSRTHRKQKNKRMRVDEFDFDLPAGLMTVKPDGLGDHHVGELPKLLQPGDLLVFNDTRVIPAQLDGHRGNARIGATLHKREGPRRWRAFIRNAKRLNEGDEIDFGTGVRATATEREEDGSF